MCSLKEGLFSTSEGSTGSSIRSPTPVSLKIAYVVIGHPLSLGSVHPNLIEEIVVSILKGALRPVGFRQALIVSTKLSTEYPLMLRD